VRPEVRDVGAATAQPHSQKLLWRTRVHPHAAEARARERGRPSITESRVLKPHRSTSFVGLIFALSGCSFLREQVGVSTAADCVDRNCAHQEGAARQQCSTECANRYGQ